VADPSLSITVGLPLSGKSTFCREFIDGTKQSVVVCPDTVRLALHGQQFQSLAEPFVWAIVQTMVRTLLKEGFKVIVDATNTTRERRKMWVNIAKEFGLSLDIFWVATPTEECHKRNLALNRLSPTIIGRLGKQFETPTEKEGKIFKTYIAKED